MKKVLLKNILEVLSTTEGTYSVGITGKKVFTCYEYCEDGGTISRYHGAPITEDMVHLFGGVFEYKESDFEKRIIIKDRDKNREHFFNEDWVEKWDVE